MNKKLVLDSSVIIDLDRKGILTNYLNQKRDEGYEVLVPRAIAREIIDDPKKYAEEIKTISPELAEKILSSVQRMKTTIDHGLIKVEPVDYKKYSRIMNNTRKYLSKLDAKPEHAVKKGDPELIILVIQLYDKHKEKITVSTKDKGLLSALKPFSKRVEYEVLRNL